VSAASSLAASRPAPDLIDAVVGFRQWRLRDGLLWSMYADTAWPSGRAVAKCLATGPQSDHRARCAEPPAKSCECGIYAWYRPCPRLGSASTDLVAGAVAMWGRVELHATGMRAEFATVVALALPLWPGAKRGRLEAMAVELGVDLVPARRLCAAALAHGDPVPAALKPRRARLAGARNARARRDEPADRTPADRGQS
jgi:hypothetical protein